MAFQWQRLTKKTTTKKKVGKADGKRKRKKRVRQVKRA